MAPRTPEEQRARAMQRRAAYLDCRTHLERLAHAVSTRRPQPELDQLAAAARLWLRDNPANR